VLSGLDYAAFLGWYLAEGNLVDRDQAICIAQSKSASRERLRVLLEERCGFTVSWSAAGATIYSADWWAHLKEQVPFGSAAKAIPARVKRASPLELSALFEALMDGDGHWYAEAGGGGAYYTASRQLAADVAEVALKLGYIVHTYERQRPGRLRAYAVNVKRTASGGTEVLTGHHVYDVETITRRRSDVQQVQYDGPVYCIGVDDTHSFVLRQDGAVWISGNSWVRQHFVDGVDPKVAFVPASLEDNPYIDQASYLESLAGLDPVTLAQLLHGDWDVVQAGNMFKRETFPIIGVGELPVHMRHWVRFWDCAASEETPGARDPDWTVGLLLGQDYEDRAYVVDVVRGRWSPGKVENVVLQTAADDGRSTSVRMEQEPGSAGVKVIEDFARKLRGYDFLGVPATGKKDIRARPVSAAASRGDIFLVDTGQRFAEWFSPFMLELEAFPTEGVHDDQVDAFSGAYNSLRFRADVGTKLAEVNRALGRRRDLPAPTGDGFAGFGPGA
jgi:predicted phage terminase large subunit-like protein